jgi:hypothetical protein
MKIPNATGTGGFTTLPNTDATGGYVNLANLPDKTYSEGGINYERKGGQIYKNGVLVPESNYKYIPSAIGGTRGVTLPTTTVTDDTTGGTTGGATGGTTDGTTPNTGYSAEVMALLKLLQDQANTPFTYDVKTDPLYGPMKEQYQQMGQRAFSDTLGKLSALTGGRPSTAGVGTAAGAQNQYLQDFSSTVLPSLTEQAYNRSQDQFSNQLGVLGAMTGMEDSTFDKTLALSEFEWSKSENNPAVKGQILNNIISQFQIDHQDEEYAMKIREWEAAISQAETIAKYAPAQAEAELNKVYADIANTNSAIAARTAETNKAKEEDVKPTLEQESNYMYVRDSFLNGEKTSQEIFEYMKRVGEKTYIDLMGEALFEQMKEEIRGKTFEATDKTPVYSLADIKKGVADIYDSFEPEADSYGKVKPVDTAARTKAMIDYIFRNSVNLEDYQIDELLEVNGLPSFEEALKIYQR